MTWTFVHIDYVLQSHREQLEEHGGLDGVRDQGALMSALVRPWNVVHYGGEPDAAELAAAYLVGLVKAHAFIDGNKRVAWVTAVLFLEFNGLTLNAPTAEAESMVLQAASSELTEAGVADWIRPRLRIATS